MGKNNCSKSQTNKKCLQKRKQPYVQAKNTTLSQSIKSSGVGIYKKIAFPNVDLERNIGVIQISGEENSTTFQIQKDGIYNVQLSFAISVSGEKPQEPIGNYGYAFFMDLNGAGPMNIDDSAIIGTSLNLQPNTVQVAVYSFNKMIDCLIDQDICQDEEEAEDFICYNESFSQAPHCIILDL